MTPPATGRGFSRPVRPVGTADNDGANGAMIEQPDEIYDPISNPVAVTLPDGKRLEFAGPVTGTDIAAAIGPGLAKAAIAIRIDGRPRDLATLIGRDAAVSIITRDTAEGLEILRHDAAH